VSSNFRTSGLNRYLASQASTDFKIPGEIASGRSEVLLGKRLLGMAG
jgi:hypothetical protein